MLEYKESSNGEGEWLVQRIVRSHLIEKLGKVSRETGDWPDRGKHQPKQNKRGCGERAWFIFRKQPVSLSWHVWTCVYRDYRRQTLKNLVGPSCGGASLPEPQFRIMKAIERKDDLIFNNNKKRKCE